MENYPPHFTTQIGKILVYTTTAPHVFPFHYIDLQFMMSMCLCLSPLQGQNLFEGPGDISLDILSPQQSASSLCAKYVY